jgi:peptidoglycan/LPS O-acetylase OafA/YrhL
MSKVYLKGLDGLRGIAALLVVFGHVELLKKANGFKNVSDGGGPFFLYLGSHAVTFFFVLSGFLITFLLLKEREKYGTISVKKFYIRRILRIWPVYYLLFILGFVVLRQVNFPNLMLPLFQTGGWGWSSFFCNILLLPNFSPVSNPAAFQSWSIGVEEQFYILWPLALFFIKEEKKLIIMMVLIVISIYFLRAGILYNHLFSTNYQILNDVNSFFGSSRFDNMATGGLLAIFYRMKPELRLKMVFKILIYACFAIIIIITPTIGFGIDMIFASIVFAGLIFDTVTNPKIHYLEIPVFKFFGKISYGIYMFHVIGIYVALNLLKSIFPLYSGNETVLNLLLYLFSILTTIGISTLSYYFYESKFLKLKDRLSTLNG